MIDNDIIKRIAVAYDEAQEDSIDILDILENEEAIEAAKLAKLYLSVSSKMPDEKDYDLGFFGHEEKIIRNIIGDVISECTLSAMKMIEEKDKRIDELEKQLEEKK